MDLHVLHVIREGEGERNAVGASWILACAFRGPWPVSDGCGAELDGRKNTDHWSWNRQYSWRAMDSRLPGGHDQTQALDRPSATGLSALGREERYAQVNGKWGTISAACTTRLRKMEKRTSALSTAARSNGYGHRVHKFVEIWAKVGVPNTGAPVVQDDKRHGDVLFLQKIQTG